MSMLDQLVEMGFDRARAEHALRETNEVGLVEAMNYLLEHDNDSKEPSPTATQPNLEMKCEQQHNESGPSGHDRQETPVEAGPTTQMESSSVVQLIEDDEPTPAPREATPPPQASVTPAQPLSFKCLVCGKMFADTNKLSMHAEITKHDRFEQSTEEVKPLTEEEKKQRLEAAQAKLKEVRAQKEAQEKKEAIEKEIKRRRDGQSMAQAEEERRQREMKEWAEAKKREKREEELARRRILEQIKLDREARKNADNPGIVAPRNVEPNVVTAPAASSSNDARLQIRLPDGSLIRETFQANEILASVRVWAQMKGEERGVFSGDIELISPFPRRTFTQDDYAKPLKALGLVPSASLVAQPLPTSDY